MHNFQNELQMLGMDQYHAGELIPMDPMSQQLGADIRRCGRCGFGCGGFRCGGFRCGGCFGCGGCGFGCGGCFGCVGFGFGCFGLGIGFI